MSDLVKYLRTHKRHGIFSRFVANDLGKAADLIEQLQQRVRELEKELANEKSLQSHSNHIMKLKHDNATLAAHVDRLRCVCAKVCSQMPERITNEQKELMLMTSPYGGKTPQTSLAQVRAKQAEESFIAGVKCVTDTDESVYEAAEEHANKIRKGKDGE